jgi:hypothetical protein
MSCFFAFRSFHGDNRRVTKLTKFMKGQLAACGLFAILFLAGCPRIVHIDYQSSGSIQGQGTVHIGNFSYVASEQGQLSPRQVELHPRAAGSLYLSNEVGAFFADAVKQELAHAGYQVQEGADRSVSGRIHRFFLDWVDTSEMTFQAKVEFTVRRNDQVQYTDTVSCRAEKPKMVTGDGAVIADGTRTCIVQFLQAAQEAKAL